MKRLLLFAFLIEMSWLQIQGSSKSILELEYDDGTKDQLIFERKDIDTPKMWEKVNKLIKQRENE